MASNKSINISNQQKDRLLVIFECPKYTEFAKVKPAKTKSECEDFWTKASNILNNTKPGSTKLPSAWRRSWRDLVGYTVKLARTKARVKEQDPSSDVLKIEYTMDDNVNDRIMSLVGWELADICNQDDESDMEKENDPLYMPPANKARKRSYSPLNFGESRTKSPSLPMSPLGFDLDTSSPGSPSPFPGPSSAASRSPLPGPSSAASPLTCKCNCKAELHEMKQALQKNTIALENLVAEVQRNFANIMVLNVDSVEPAQPAEESSPPVIVVENEGSPVVVVENEEPYDVLSEFLQLTESSEKSDL